MFGTFYTGDGKDCQESPNKKVYNNYQDNDCSDNHGLGTHMDINPIQVVPSPRDSTIDIVERTI